MSVELLSHPEAYISLLTLTAMEIILGIDNIIFIAILVGKLPKDQRQLAQRLGISLALILRLLLLFAISWVMGLQETLFEVLGEAISGRDLILLSGGLFLIGKSAHEMYDKLEAAPVEESQPGGRGTFGVILVQILALDVVFSLDSVITAVGMAEHIAVMVVAMVLAVGVMLISANGVSRFVERHPSMKILALSFLLLIGVMLVADGLGQHIGKGYIYFAMAFALLVEILNMRLRKSQPVTLNERY